MRPEKLTIVGEVDADRIPENHNRITGRVTDVSYTAVSTQYLVETDWRHELTVFEQNVVVGDRSDVGDRVILHWAPSHTFGLDVSGGATVGVDTEVLALGALNARLLGDAKGA